MSWAWEEMKGKQSGIQGCLWALLDHDLHGIIFTAPINKGSRPFKCFFFLLKNNLKIK
jgi:hypothetical protein